MTLVWEHSKQKGSALLLLLALADFANDDGEAWPAIATLATKIRMSERYTQMLIGELVKAGEITVRPPDGRYSSNVYVITSGVKPASPMKEAGVKPASSRGEARLTRGVKPASPDPSINYQEPSEGSAPKKPARPPKANYYPLAEALASVCHMPLKANPRLFAEAELLSKADPAPTPELLQQHYSNNPDCFWRRADWRGRKGEEPSPAAIRETWGRWNKAAPVEHYVEYS